MKPTSMAGRQPVAETGDPYVEGWRGKMPRGGSFLTATGVAIQGDVGETGQLSLTWVYGCA